MKKETMQMTNKYRDKVIKAPSGWVGGGGGEDNIAQQNICYMWYACKKGSR